MKHRSFSLCAGAAFLVACSGPAADTTPETTAATPATEAAAAPATGPVAPPTTDADIMKSAMSAAPASVSSAATIVSVDSTMKARVVRAGTNGWTCMPDGPSPGVDPMCLDKNGMMWVQAWIDHKDPPKDKLGFGYMLMGGSDASNTDPFASRPNEGSSWVDTGPHVMVMNIGTKFDGYPTTSDNAKAPFVMWSNTPYAHLMLPVK
jgi:hypothetical protein